MGGNGKKKTHVRDTGEIESGKLLNCKKRWRKRQAIKNDTEISDHGKKVVPLTEIEVSKIWSRC